MIYLLENTDRLTENFLEEALPFLRPQRLEKINLLRALHDKTDSSAAYLLLRYGLLREYGITDAPLFRFGEHGKPYLCEHEHIYFNFSHAKNAVCCILSDYDTAVDITDIRQVGQKTISRVCDIDEQHMIAQSSDPQRAFLRLWTRKECLSKLSGKGLTMGFAGVTDKSDGAENVHTIEKPDYIMSYYSRGEEKINVLPKDSLVDSLSLLSGNK